MNQNEENQRCPIRFNNSDNLPDAVTYTNQQDSQNILLPMLYTNPVQCDYPTNSIESTLAMRIKEYARVPYDYPFNDFHFSRTQEGWIKLEAIIDFPDRRKVYSMKTDGIYYFDSREIVMMHYPNIEERNKQIQKLYKEKDMTQVFLGKIFGLSQPAISRIIKSLNIKIR